MGSETTMKCNNVARTCNRFSRFLKERRSFGEVGFTSVITSPKVDQKKSLDLFPLTSSSSNLNFEESTQHLALSRNSAKSKDEPEKTLGSMTIIYDGKVLVFDGLHDEMAQEIVSLASQSVATTPQCETSQRNNYTNTTHLTHALSDLPIARGASLLRFMEKRKDRIAASAPYRVNNSNSSKQLFEQQLEFKLW
ncbi:protein TIFY 10B-like [Silene latifolia]|uniref:protein TIFY 10B-like n=1 Tax=Silene latifolia TaxID=37657 RepID=UPI003D76E131